MDDDYEEPDDRAHPADDVDNGWHGNDAASQPQYAEVISTRRIEEPMSRRPYADVSEYASIDHRIPRHTYLVVVDDSTL